MLDDAGVINLVLNFYVFKIGEGKACLVKSDNSKTDTVQTVQRLCTLKPSVIVFNIKKESMQTCVEKITVSKFTCRKLLQISES